MKKPRKRCVRRNRNRRIGKALTEAVARWADEWPALFSEGAVGVADNGYRPMHVDPLLMKAAEFYVTPPLPSLVADPAEVVDLFLPRSMRMSAETWRALRSHPKIAARVKQLRDDTVKP